MSRNNEHGSNSGSDEDDYMSDKLLNQMLEFKLK